MIALHQNNSNFYANNIMPFFDNKNSIKNTLGHYIDVYEKIYSAKKYFDSFLKNLDIVLELNNLDTVEKIDSVLINLEKISEINEDILTSPLYKIWYLVPARYAIDKMEDSNLSLQALLTSKQAELSK